MTAVAPKQQRPARRPTSSRWRGTRSRASSAVSASTRKSTSRRRRVAECHSTSSIFRGYSIFMKGKDPRDAHFITSRICGICGDNHATCSVYNQNMAYGVRPPHLGEWIINLGEAAEYMFDHNLYQDNLACVDYCEKMVADTNPGVLELANRTPEPARRGPRLPHHRRHHAGPQPVHRRVLPRDAEGLPLHARDVLPDGGPARPPVDALPGRGRHGGDDPALHRLHDPAHVVHRVHEAGRADARRPLRLHVRGAARLRGGRSPPGHHRLVGRVQRPGALRLRLQDHVELGTQDVRLPRGHRRREARHHRPRRHQPRHPHPAGQLLLPGLGGPGEVRRPRPARQPGLDGPPLEPAHDPGAAEARLRRQVLVDDVAALVRRHGPPRDGHRRRPARPGSGSPRSPGWSTPAATSGRPDTASSSTSRARCRSPRRRSPGPRRSTSRAVRCPTRSSGTAPAPTSRPTRPRRRCTSWRRRSPRSAAGTPRPGSRSSCPTSR